MKQCLDCSSKGHDKCNWLDQVMACPHCGGKVVEIATVTPLGKMMDEIFTGITEKIISDTAAEAGFLRDWAGRHKAIFDDEGECGIGRECVGIRTDDRWIDLGPSIDEFNSGYAFPKVVEGAEAPEDVNAYHKHDCLAVLGRGPVAIHQLYTWVKQIEANGLVIKRAYREPQNAIDLIINGTEYVYLDKP